MISGADYPCNAVSSLLPSHASYKVPSSGEKDHQDFRHEQRDRGGTQSFRRNTEPSRAIEWHVTSGSPGVTSSNVGARASGKLLHWAQLRLRSYSRTISPCMQRVSIAGISLAMYCSSLDQGASSFLCPSLRTHGSQPPEEHSLPRSQSFNGLPGSKRRWHSFRARLPGRGLCSSGCFHSPVLEANSEESAGWMPLSRWRRDGEHPFAKPTSIMALLRPVGSMLTACTLAAQSCYLHLKTT